MVLNRFLNSIDTKSKPRSVMAVALLDTTYPPLQCPACDHVASTRTDTEHHYRASHHDQKCFVCMHPYCQQSYRSKPGLKYHLEHMHVITYIPDPSAPIVHRPTISPPPVGPSTGVRSSRHQLTAMQDRERKRASLSPELEQLLDAAYDPLVCPVCRAEFKRKTNVIHHLVEVHRGEEPYHCIINGCDHQKAYAHRVGLVYHIATHHDRDASSSR